MLDPGDFAIGNVRIDRYLRWRRNGNGNRGACDSGNVGHHGNIGNVNVIRNIGDIGNIDIVRNARDLGDVGDVRFRIEQHRFIVGTKSNVTDNAGRRCSYRASVGIYRDRQPWGQLRSSGSNTERIAECWFRRADCGRTDRPHDYVSVRWFVSHGKPGPVPKWRHWWSIEHYERLLKTPFIRELDQR